MRARTIAAAVLVGLLALGAWWYASPYVAMRSTLEAAQQRDAERFNRYVDYPRVRENLKDQLGERVGEAMGAGRGDEAGRAMGALGSLLATALADRFIDALVRPEVVMRAMTEARLQVPPGRDERRRGDGRQDGGTGDRPGPGPGHGGEGSGGGSAEPDADAPKRRDVDWRFERSGVDRVIAWGGKPGSGMDERTGFVFERSGFATWKLTEIRVP